MIMIYALIFRVDLKRGSKFMQIEDIMKEKESSQNDNNDMQKKLEEI